MSDELEAARKALETTLFDQGKSKDYIDDFLKHYDRNLKNIDDWRQAKELQDLWQCLREGRLEVGESIALRADDRGKPSFHLTPEAFKWLLDNLNSLS